MPEQGDQILPRHVERGIGAVARHSGTEQRHPTGVEGRKGLLALEQIRALIVAVAERAEGAVGLPALGLGIDRSAVRVAGPFTVEAVRPRCLTPPNSPPSSAPAHCPSRRASTGSAR